MTDYLDTLKKEILNNQEQYEHELFRKQSVQLVIDEYNKQGKSFYLKLEKFILDGQNSK